MTCKVSESEAWIVHGERERREAIFAHRQSLMAFEPDSGQRREGGRGYGCDMELELGS